MSVLSERIKSVQPSATLKVTALAKKMKRQGEDVISFAAGEPDFDTPDFIKQAAVRSLDHGDTKYTPASGLDDLKSAVVNKFLNENGLEYSNENIIISCGAKHSIYNILQVMLDPTDEVILFLPYWVSYFEQVKLAQGVPVVVDTISTDFKMNFDELESKISEKTKLIIVNSPQNPSGAVYSEEELNRLAGIVLKHENIYILSDEIYEKFIYDGQKHCSISQTPHGQKIKDRIIIVNGLSKTFAMTGWRIGYMAAPAEIAKAVGVLQSHSTSNPTTFCQTASITALNSDSEQVGEMTKQFEQRRDLIYNLLNSIDGIEVKRPEGAFYIFPEVTGILNKEYFDTDLH